jgi:N-acetylmuramoyl-L-alanine amidase
MPKKHTVAQGECLSSIAAQYGFASWRAVYDHPDNQAFRAVRPNPNVLLPGDQLSIPDKVQKAVSCATAATHVFVLSGPKTRFRLELRSGTGRPYARKRYELTAGGVVSKGVTDAAGLVDQPIPAEARDGQLIVWASDDPGSSCRIPLDFGALDPAHERTGAEARLANLGFSAPDRADALRAFQAAHGLEVTGVLDEASIAKLREQHDE